MEDKSRLFQIEFGKCENIFFLHSAYSQILTVSVYVQVRRDRSDFWEGIKAHNATVTCAIFAPHPEAIIKSEPDDDDISRVSVSGENCRIN